MDDVSGEVCWYRLAYAASGPSLIGSANRRGEICMDHLQIAPATGFEMLSQRDEEPTRLGFEHKMTIRQRNTVELCECVLFYDRKVAPHNSMDSPTKTM